MVLAARSFPSAALDGVCGGGAQCSSPFPFELRRGGALSTSLLPLAAAGCEWGTLLAVAFPVPVAAEDLLLLLNEGAHAVLYFFVNYMLVLKLISGAVALIFMLFFLALPSVENTPSLFNKIKGDGSILEGWGNSEEQEFQTTLSYLVELEPKLWV